VELGIVFGIGSALAFGAGDFTGGTASRSLPALAVAAGAQVVGLVGILAVLLISGAPAPHVGALWIGATAGLAGGLGLAALYRGLSMGSMGIVTALSGVGSVVIPLVVGALLGASVTGLQLVGVGFAAMAAIAASGATLSGGMRGDALRLAAIAGISFGAWFVLLDLAAEGDALWALVASRASSSVLVTAVAIVVGTRISPEARGSTMPLLGLVALAGVLDVAGNGLFVLARGEIAVGLAAAMSGVYPLVTMVLARAVGGEELPPLGLLGVLLAVIGIVLISLG
jgi:drug/metabolite transporter (DMT)-like permease